MTRRLRASVEAPFQLLTSPTCVVGVSPGHRSDEVVVTQQSQGVSVYNVRSQECVKHWAMRADVRLTHPAVLHPKGRRFLVVREHSTLLSWASDAPEVDFGCSKTVSADCPPPFATTTPSHHRTTARTHPLSRRHGPCALSPSRLTCLFCECCKRRRCSTRSAW